MKIYLGADHRGFKLKEHIKPWLTHWEYDFSDLGALTLDPKDDYTTYAQKVAIAVQKNKNALGILICGSGAGVEITANKFNGIRATIGVSAAQIEAARHDDNINILVLASNFISEKEAKDMIKVFLRTKFSTAVRFKKRLKQIAKIEKENA